MRIDEDTSRRRGWRRATLLAVAAFLCVAAVITYRTVTKLNIPGRPDLQQYWALEDFGGSIYYPVASFLAGDNPYDPRPYVLTHPVNCPFPPYLPATLLIHLPLGLVPYPTAEWLYYALTLVLMPLLAWLALRLAGVAPTAPRIFGVAALLLASRPGHWNLILGQPTALVVIGAYVALLGARQRPWSAGLGLAVSTLKPTFGLPLAILMLARGDTRAVLLGLAISGALCAAATAVLVRAAGGIGPLVASVHANYLAFTADPWIQAATSYDRVDAVAFVSRFLGRSLGGMEQLAIAATLLGVGALVVRRLARAEAESPPPPLPTPGIGAGTERVAARSHRAASQNDGTRRLSGSIICLTVLLAVYHHQYDLLLLAFPLTALVVGTLPRVAVGPRLRWLLVALLAVPAANYLASATALDALGFGETSRVVVASVNGAILLVTLAIGAWAASRRSVPA